MELQKITTEQQQMLDAPLPAEAVSPHPTKNYLSTIKAIYVTERLNDSANAFSVRLVRKVK